MSEMQPNPTQHELIDRIPTQEELEAKAEADAQQIEFSSMAITRNALNAIISGNETEKDPRILNQKYPDKFVPRELPPLPELPKHEPYVPQPHERRISGEELRKLREQIAAEDAAAKPTQQ